MPDSTRRSVPKGSAPDDKASGRRDRRAASGEAPIFVVTTPAVAADEVAEMALRLRAQVQLEEAPLVCDACDTPIDGEPAGSGLFVWSRGEDRPRIEEPPLCESCATAIGVTALRTWDTEEEEEG
jgi:hypothetical protein